MTDTYTKLFSSITASTIWQEPDGTRLTWITMLAMAKKDGCVYGSVPGLAHQAKVSVEAVRTALACFLAPDPDSRTKDFEGRRVEEIDGGWRLLNHEKFRQIRSAEERREYMREYMRSKREKERLLAESLAMSTDVAPPAPAPAPKEKAQDMATSSPTTACPIQKIVELYHLHLPMLPKVEKITRAREGYIKQRWREDLTELSHWENFFDFVKTSPFLTGRVEATNGRPPFRADLEWLTRPTNYVKIAEDRYHHE